ncbi:ATP-binding protein [Desulfosediminicola ganghwensis]|uniref:ATP-binding protein n=1 Tax=Desulfosediminicola ganghwensis TaxID=2569540 RepID=UPI0010ACA536|nr:4Fe-4S dicluster domain-containing protein [Desulfosediminicola ganghwensis]
MKNIRKIIKIDEELCNGCGVCVPDCAEGSLKIIDGKAKLVADNLCDGLGACLGSCPTGALQIIEREADEFDEEAVEQFLAEEKRKQEKEQPATPAATMDCGCASSHIQSFNQPIKPMSSCQTASQPRELSVAAADEATSSLQHWPVQIRLVPPTAPFLQNAHLLVAADCTAVAARSFQEKYLDGKAVMMGCPKFDDAELYIQRFTDIFQTCNLQSITVLIMEVPCCSSMNVIIDKALKRSGVDVPVKRVTLSVRGEEVIK